MSARQDSFRAALFNTETAPPDGLTDGHGQPAGRRFAVYRNTVASSLITALETSFPATAKTVGTGAFRQIAGTYMRQHPPTSPMMMYYGDSFPAFLRELPAVAHLRYLPDLAMLEQARREAYHAQDAPPADLAALASLSPDRLATARPGLAPALRLVRSDWPVHGIWAFNMTQAAPKPPHCAQNVLITRPAFDPEMTVIDDAMVAFVQSLAMGRTLQDATDHATAHAPSFDLGTALGPLLAGRAICHINAGDH